MVNAPTIKFPRTRSSINRELLEPQGLDSATKGDRCVRGGCRARRQPMEESRGTVDEEEELGTGQKERRECRPRSQGRYDSGTKDNTVPAKGPAEAIE